MFDAFRNSYPRDTGPAPRPAQALSIPNADLRAFFEEFGGASFKGGVYRVIQPSDAENWRLRVALAFPDFSQRSTCFGYDWQGRVFALDSNRSHDAKPAVLLIEPGFDEVLEIPANLATFHDKILIDESDAAVASTFYEQWIASGGTPPAHDQCVGYKRPCFLGGVDGIENIELCDLDVYWHLMGQLLVQVRGLPPGARVRIKLD